MSFPFVELYGNEFQQSLSESHMEKSNPQTRWFWYCIEQDALTDSNFSGTHWSLTQLFINPDSAIYLLAV